jgi:hypothetical protein
MISLGIGSIISAVSVIALPSCQATPFLLVFTIPDAETSECAVVPVIGHISERNTHAGV